MTESIFHPKPVDELTFTDDGMFQAVLRDPEICAELIERLLHLRVNHIEYPEVEKTIAPYYKMTNRSRSFIMQVHTKKKRTRKSNRSFISFTQTNRE